MTGDKDMFHELADNDSPRKYVTFGDDSKGKVVGLGKVAISHDSSIQNVMLIESLGSYIFYEDLYRSNRITTYVCSFCHRYVTCPRFDRRYPHT